MLFVWCEHWTWYTLVYAGILWYTLVYGWYTAGIRVVYGFILVYGWYTGGIRVVYGWYTRGIRWYTLNTVYHHLPRYTNIYQRIPNSMSTSNKMTYTSSEFGFENLYPRISEETFSIKKYLKRNLWKKKSANKSLPKESLKKKISRDIPDPYQKLPQEKNYPKKLGREMFYKKLFEGKSLPENLRRLVLYQKFSEQEISLLPKYISIDNSSTKDYLQKHLYQKISEDKNLAKQIKKHLHQNFCQEKCLAKTCLRRNVYQNVPRHCLPKSFSRCTVPKNLRR